MRTRSFQLCGLVLIASSGCGAPKTAPAPQAVPTAIPAVLGDTIAKSGLTYIDARVGTGAVAERSRCVFTRYVGWLANGKLFDFVLDTTLDGKPRDPLGFVIGQR